MKKKKLKTLEELEAFDGEKYTAPIPRDSHLEPIPLSRDEIVERSATHVRLKSGRVWQGKNINLLYEELKKQVKADHTS